MLSGMPDLAITSVTAPSSAIEGNAATITVEWTVENNGGAATAPWTDAVYLSTEPTLVAGSVRIASLDESSQAPLAQSASYTISHQITLPAFATGSDYLIVRTNDSGSLDEISSTDDLYSRPLVLNPPDVSLMATSPTATGPGGDASVAAGDGQKLAVSWRVENEGDDTAMAAWKDAIYLSRDDTFDPIDDQLLDTQAFAPQTPLAHGAHYTQHDSIVVPDTAITGDCYLLIVPDADHGQGEASGAGVIASTPITITPTSNVNLALSATVPTDTVVEGDGQQIDFSYTVTNTGSAPALSAWTDAIYLSTTPNVDSSAVKLDYSPGPSRVALAPQASYVENGSVDIPVMHVTEPTTYYLIIETDSGDVQSESDKSDNIWTKSITVSPPQVDLAITAAAPASTTVGIGGEVSVSYTVVNKGSQAPTGIWEDSLYLSAKPTFDPTAQLLVWQGSGGGRFAATLSPSGQYAYTLQYALPPGATGERYLFVVTNDRSNRDFNPDFGQDEADFSNNVSSGLAINITPSNIDLALSNASYVDASGNVPTSVEAGNGQQVYLRWTAQNLGSSPSDAWSAGVYLSNDANRSGSSLGPDGNLFGGVGNALSPYQEQVMTGTSIAEGGSLPGSPEVTIPNAPAGTHDLILVADPDDQQGELRMTNNAVAMPITLTTPNVDLQVTGDNAPPTAVAGGSFNLTWNVTNGGAEGASGGWTDQVYISDVPELTPNADLLASFTTVAGKTLPSQQTRTTDPRQVTLPAVTGQRWLLFVTNATRTQGELDYGNDVDAVPITVTNGLAASDVSLTSQAITLGQTVGLNWTVTNTSGATTNGTWTDNVYLCPSPTLDPFGFGDLFVTSLSGPAAPLGPGDCVSSRTNDRFQFV